jgi:cation diffusion facilitator CzcD-associated flavoprotein CzcO
MERLPVAIVGAGFSGLGMSIALKRGGHDNFVVFEVEDGVGGTWRANTYPGCGCDIPSHMYSFSFERNPRWSRSFSRQPEILEYLERCTDRYGIRPHIRFRERVERAEWDDATRTWTVSTSAGRCTRARMLVSAPGPLVVPSYPSIAGTNDFAGPMFHSARWNHDVDLRGKRVAVVGTGASAIQVVPAIASTVGRLHVFQRTPPWVVHKPDHPISERMQRLYARHPALSRANRSLIYGVLEALGTTLFVEPRLMRLRERMALRHMRSVIEDPELRRKVTPSYRMGCKRILPSNDWYPALVRDNVELVTDGIERFTEEGIVTVDGRLRPVDVVVFCTGFDPRGGMTGYDVIGRDGRNLADLWTDEVEAYFGIAVAGFPNFFTLVGPNTGLGHNSIVFMIEAQVRYVMQCLRMLGSGEHQVLEVRADAQRAFNRALHERMNHVVWSTGCNSWYLDERGKNYALWPGSTVEYWLRTRRVDEGAFVR